MTDRFLYASFSLRQRQQLSAIYQTWVACVVVETVGRRYRSVLLVALMRIIAMLQGAILTTMLATRNFSSKYDKAGK